MDSAKTPSALHNQLTELFRSGERGNTNTQLLGLEVEHFIVSEDGTPITYDAPTGSIGTRDVLEYLAAAFPQRCLEQGDNLLSLVGPTGSISLEAGSQLEYSIAPYAHVAQVEKAYTEFRSLVDPYLADHGFRIETCGYHPTRRARDLGLTPHERYSYMDGHFARYKGSGRSTMRATAATQVSVDYSCERDAIRKLRIASALAPVLAAIADNSPVYEGSPNHTPIRRIMLWRSVGNRRGGTAPRLFSNDFCFGTYANWLLATSPIYTLANETEPCRPCVQTAQDAFAQRVPSRRDAEHLASVVWPDARLKHIVEIRPADCMPADCVLGYVALIKGLLYNERSLQTIERYLGVVDDHWPLTSEDVNLAIAQIQEWGGMGQVYGMPLYLWEDILFSLARLALDESDRHYLLPLETFAADKHWWRVR